MLTIAFSYPTKIINKDAAHSHNTTKQPGPSAIILISQTNQQTPSCFCRCGCGSAETLRRPLPSQVIPACQPICMSRPRKHLQALRPDVDTLCLNSRPNS